MKWNGNSLHTLTTITTVTPIHQSYVLFLQISFITDPCVVPYEFDSLISISNRQFISLSGGSVVEDGDLVYFNCSKASELAYEPFNRRFKCMKGLWIEDDRDKTWKFGNNGTFPKCRKGKKGRVHISIDICFFLTGSISLYRQNKIQIRLIRYFYHRKTLHFVRILS